MLAESRDKTFQAQLEPHRRAITAHCYRMLGSFQDAEEIAQESLLRGWQRLEELKSGGAARSWLYRIATNACLDRLKGRRRRALPHHVAPAADPARVLGAPAHEGLWIEPAPDTMLEVPGDPDEQPEARASMHESIGLAFVTALQLLPPKQRAALLLVDVLGWTPREAAALLETTEVSVNSLLQRARKNRELGGVEPPPAAPPDDDTELLRRYITSWESRDLDAFTALLAEDAVLSMPPRPEWYAGRDAIRQFVANVFFAPGREYRLIALKANGVPAFAVYDRGAPGEPFIPAAIKLLSIRAGSLVQMTGFAYPHLFPRFGLPDRLPAT